MQQISFCKAQSQQLICALGLKSIKVIENEIMSVLCLLQIGADYKSEIISIA